MLQNQTVVLVLRGCKHPFAQSRLFSWSKKSSGSFSRKEERTCNKGRATVFFGFKRHRPGFDSEQLSNEGKSNNQYFPAFVFHAVTFFLFLVCCNEHMSQEKKASSRFDIEAQPSRVETIFFIFIFNYLFFFYFIFL